MQPILFFLLFFGSLQPLYIEKTPIVQTHTRHMIVVQNVVLQT